MPERYSYEYEVVADERRSALTREPVIPTWSSMSFIIALRVCNIIKNNTDEQQHSVFERNLLFRCVRLCPDRENFDCDGVSVSAEACKILGSILEAFTGHVVPEFTREAMAGDFGRLACRMLRDERYAKCRKLHATATISVFSDSPMISRLSSRPPEPTSAWVIEALERCQLIPFRSQEETCAVCLAEIPAQSVITRLPCQHFFHDDCIVPWLRINRVCPLCGSVLPR